jgi:hypothetical protein
MIDLDLFTVAEMYELRVALNNRIEAIEADAMERISAGESINGFALKKGVNRRYVIDEKD